jgi:small subunit ribosomal protein S1
MAEAPLNSWKPPELQDAKLTAGQIVECVVLGKVEAQGQKRSVGYAVDIGMERPALVPRSQVALQPNRTLSRTQAGRTGWAELPVGTVVRGQISRVSPSGVNVSLARVQRDLAWERVTQLASEDFSLSAPVLHLNEAGATLDVEGLPAFLPWSHWAVPMEERSWKLIGTRLSVKFLEVNQLKARLVVSNRRVSLDGAMSELVPGTLVEGRVAQIKDYGAVVELESGIKGLLHVSQLSKAFVKDVKDCIDVGDRVCCIIIKVDENDGSVSLSTKRLEEKPGEMLRDAAAIFERASARGLSTQAGGEGGGAAAEE